MLEDSKEIFISYPIN